MRYYDPDMNGVRYEPTGVFFRTEEEYEHYKGYMEEEENVIKAWPLTEEYEQDEEDDR